MYPPTLLPGAVNIKCVVTALGNRWWVYWSEGVGLVAHKDDELDIGYLLHTTADAFHHAAVLDEGGSLIVAWSAGAMERPGEQRKVDAWSLPQVDLTTLNTEPITPVRLPRWMVWFEFGTTRNPAPQNGSLATNDLILRTREGMPFAQYTAVEAQGNTPQAYAEAIQMAKRRHPTLPVAAYVPWQVQRTGYVPPCEWTAVEMYKRNTETLGEAEQRWKSYAARCKRVLMIPQCYTSNLDQTQNLKSLVPLYSRVMQLPNVVGAAVFSNSGRRTGLNDHPEVKPLWEELFRTIPSAPPIELIVVPPIVVVVPVEPTTPVEDVMIDDDKFIAMCEDTARALTDFIPKVSHEELTQGCRQMGDKYRKPKNDGGLYERNASAVELAFGSYMRDGKTHLDDTKVQQLFEALAPVDKEYLQR